MVISVRTVSNASYSTARGVWMVLLTAGLVPTIFRKAFFLSQIPSVPLRPI